VTLGIDPAYSNGLSPINSGVHYRDRRLISIPTVINVVGAKLSSPGRWTALAT
jgi:hypothetical protein